MSILQQPRLNNPTEQLDRLGTQLWCAHTWCHHAVHVLPHIDQLHTRCIDDDVRVCLLSRLLCKMRAYCLLVQIESANTDGWQFKEGTSCKKATAIFASRV